MHISIIHMGKKHLSNQVDFNGFLAGFGRSIIHLPTAIVIIQNYLQPCAIKYKPQTFFLFVYIYTVTFLANILTFSEHDRGA